MTRPGSTGAPHFRPRAVAALVGAVGALAVASAPAQTWTFTPSVGLQETYTSNVNLSPSATAKSDFVTQVTPQLAISERSPRTSLDGFIAAPTLVYVRTGDENNQVYPSVSLTGKAEAIERFLFVDGAVSVSQQFFSPFGAQPQGLANATENRYTNASYRVSPFIKGTTPGRIEYELRNDNVWTNLSGAPVATRNAYYDQWLGRVSGQAAAFGWDVEGNWNRTKFSDQERATVTSLGRVRLIYQYDPQLRGEVDGGYEDNDYPLTKYSGAIYGVGFRWVPTPRTNLVANWEHRFFGSSYLFSFDHRTPLSSIEVRASRNTTSYPQQFLTLPATGNVPLLLNFLLLSRVPDPAQRQQIVNQLIQDQGLPTVLTSPVNLYAQQNYLQENASVTFGALGARNSTFVTAFYVKSRLISGAGNPLPPIYDPYGNNNTQTGVTATWNHRLTPMLTLNASATATRVVGLAPFAAHTNQGYANVGITATVSRNTTLSAGARFQILHSDVSPEYREVAALAGITHTFR